MSYQAQPLGPWLKGVVASNQPLAMPKGSLARSSNLALLERGALTPVDGSGILDWYSGAVQNNRGKMMAETLFAPTGVTPYYLVVARGVGQTFDTVRNLVTSDGGSGGTLSNVTYFYKVTAIDGAGGETTTTVEASYTPAAAHKVTLTWNTIPNAYGYNIYRGTGGSGSEVLISGTGLPVLQVYPLAVTTTWTDDGSDNAKSYSPLGATGFVSAGQNYITYQIAAGSTPGLTVGGLATASGFTPAGFNGTFTITNVTHIGHPSPFLTNVTVLGGPGSGVTSVSGTLNPGTSTGFPPLSDTTSQTVLYLMPGGTIPITYSDANIVARFPASPNALGQGPVSGTTFTPSGGVPGMVGMLPQFKQFTNREVIALGNGYPPQLFYDSSGTLVNPALTGAISSVSVSGDQVTAQSLVTLSATNLVVGANIIFSGMSDATYNGVFVVLALPGGNTITVRNTTASGGASTGTFTVTTQPIISTFTTAYPAWTATTAYPTGSIIVPKTQTTPTTYLTAIQGGTSGGSEPSWTNPAATGQAFPLGNFADGSIIWQETGYLNSAAPPPPGAGHIEVYANSLWVFNTSPTNVLSTGLDGPCSLRMSGQGNPNNWNPVNQAFLDKDDGFEGMALAKFTITALGIPPEGSMVAFKNRTPYQIVGVFGANNFAIQAVASDMGCTSPRTAEFVPGYGIGRLTHLGFAIFDGVKDTLISEQIRPYLFAVNDLDALDITAMDSAYAPVSWSALTANPPQYCTAIPVGNSGGQLTRILIYDLVLKAWMITDLPFGIGSMAQVQPSSSIPVTLLGGYLDGALQRWQNGDTSWYSGGGASAMVISWSCRLATMSSQDSSQRVYMRRLVVRGTNTGTVGTITVQPRRSAVNLPSTTLPIGASMDFDAFVDVAQTGVRFDATISGTAHLEIDGVTWMLEPRPIGVPVAAI